MAMKGIGWKADLARPKMTVNFLYINILVEMEVTLQGWKSTAFSPSKLSFSTLKAVLFQDCCCTAFFVNQIFSYILPLQSSSCIVSLTAIIELKFASSKLPQRMI